MARKSFNVSSNVFTFSSFETTPSFPRSIESKIVVVGLVNV